MSTNFINLLSIMHEVVLRFKKLANDDLMTVVNYFQRIVNEPEYRRQVWLAMTSKLLVDEITPEEWIERETNAMIQLGYITEEMGPNVPQRMVIEKMAARGAYGMHQYFIPTSYTRLQLIELARKVGMPINSSPNCDGEEIPTEAGVLECDLSMIMNSTDAEHRPFNLNAKEHEEWAKVQGGDGLTSAEETLYLMIRHFMTFGRILFMGGWIRCRNTHDTDKSLFVDFSADSGLHVHWDSRSSRDWDYGAVARKFQPLAT